MELDGIGNSSARISPVGREPSLLSKAREELRSLICVTDATADIVRRLRHSFKCRLGRAIPQHDLPFDRAGRIQVAAEQLPNKDSRVLLSSDRDRFGLFRVALDWRLTMKDKVTMRQAAIAVGTYFAENNIGRVRMFDWLLADNEEFPSRDDGQEVAGFHHMGTTRMGVSATDGVVDKDCRVFGVDNLYVAGSSVFRTGGYANPTLTIVQLSLRLADHLASQTGTPEIVETFRDAEEG